MNYITIALKKCIYGVCYEACCGEQLHLSVQHLTLKPSGHVCRHDKSCVAGFEKRYHGIVSAFMFATETQQTIGRLSNATNDSQQISVTQDDHLRMSLTLWSMTGI